MTWDLRAPCRRFGIFPCGYMQLHFHTLQLIFTQSPSKPNTPEFAFFNSTAVMCICSFQYISHCRFRGTTYTDGVDLWAYLTAVCSVPHGPSFIIPSLRSTFLSKYGYTGCRALWLAVVHFHSGCCHLIDLKDLFFSISIVRRIYSYSNTPDISPRLDLTTHVHHGFSTNPRRRIPASW